MNQKQFELNYRCQWQDFEGQLSLLESRNRTASKDKVDLHSFPARYRRLCNQYALAQSRHYSPALVDRLHDLVLRGHCQMYRKKNSLIWRGLQFLGRDFPQTVRSSSSMFWLAFLLFFGPAIGMSLATYHDTMFIYSIMDEYQVAQMESMYHPGTDKIGRAPERDAETDFAMFGFYIKNNISIGFRTFAGGIVFGLGSVFFLVFNGLMIGGVAGHLSHPPYTDLFWQFVAGHGSFELTAIVISGAAGLCLGRSLLFPGNLPRLQSLRSQAPIALKLVMGAALMLVCAAFIEAFWSSSRLEPSIKYWVAAVNWLLVILYLLSCGRRKR